MNTFMQKLGAMKEALNRRKYLEVTGAWGDGRAREGLRVWALRAFQIAGFSESESIKLAYELHKV